MVAALSTPAHTPGPPLTRSPLGSAFWRLFASSTASNLSDGVMQATLPLLAASISRDPVLVAMVASLAYLPWLLFALAAGALVDRVDRRRAMLGANLARTVILLALAAVALADAASIGLLYVAAFALGVAETVYDNAARAMLPRVVGRAQLERGNSLLATAESVTNMFLGAPLGAWLFALAAAVPLGGSALLFLVAGVLVLTVGGRFRPERAADTSLRADVREGLAWLVHHRVLRQLLVVTTLGALGNSLVNGIAVLFALEELGLDASGYGLLLAAGGVGAVLGSMASPALTGLVGRTASMGLTSTVCGVALAVIGAWPHPVVAFVAWPISAMAVGAFNVQVMSVRQALIPDALFGRVQGAYRTVLWGSIPLGTLAGGGLGSLLGLPGVFVTAGLLAAAAGLATWWVLFRHRDAIARAFAPPA